MAIVYEHLRNNTNKVFYVGIGVEEGRAYVKDGKNKYALVHLTPQVKQQKHIKKQG